MLTPLAKTCLGLSLIALVALTSCGDDSAPDQPSNFIDSATSNDVDFFIDARSPDDVRTMSDVAAPDAEMTGNDAFDSSSILKPDAMVDAAALPPSRNGQACGDDNQCQSGHCADGFCCNQVCNGPCESCGLAGSLGKCKNLSAGSTAKHEACSAESAASCGRTGKCDGRGGCALFSPATICRAPRCDGDTYILPGLCSGDGVCEVSRQVPCAPYSCRYNMCNVPCSDHSVCPPGTLCTPQGCHAPGASPR
jgi:hypothetical protein